MLVAWPCLGMQPYVVYEDQVEVVYKYLEFLKTLQPNGLNPLGTGDLKFYQSQVLSTFWRLFIYFLLNQSFICRGFSI